MNRILITLFLCSVCFFGCAEVNVLTIKSMEKDKEFYKGREISYKTDSIAESELEIDDVYNGKIYFYLYVKNITDKDLEVRPEKVLLKVFPTSSAFDKGEWEKSMAFDPEKELEEISEDMNNTKDHKSAEISLNCCFSFFSFIAHVADDDERYVVENAVDETAGLVERHELIEEKYANKMKDLENENEFWRKEVLHRTTLKPGESIGGIVVAPQPSKSKYINVCILFEKGEHSYLFELRKVKK